MKLAWSILFLALFSVSCSEKSEQISFGKPDEKTSVTSNDIVDIEHQPDSKVNSKTANGITYEFHTMSALEYLANKRVKPDEADLKELEQESVVMLEISEDIHDILESKKLELSRDDLNMYLCDRIIDDITIIQDGKSITPNAVQYEGKIGSGDRIRATFYLKGLKKELPYQVKFYDRIFGNGFIKIKVENNRAIV